MESCIGYFGRSGSVDISHVFNGDVDNKVISYDRFGEIKSRYSDLSWCLFDGLVLDRKINYELLSKRNIRTAKIWVYGYMEVHKKLTGLSPSASVVYQFFCSLRDIFKYCKSRVSLVKFFESKVHIASFVRTLPAYKAQYFLLVIKFVRLCKSDLNINLRIDKKISGLINSLVSLSNDNRRQTPVVPSSILFRRIENCQISVDEFLNYEEGFKKLLNHYCLNSNPVEFGISNYEDYFVSFDNDGDFSKLVEKYTIDTKFKFVGYLMFIQQSCKELVHIYSGMRKQEVLDLRYNCLSKVVVNKSKVLRLIGNTSKLTRQKKQVKWVTSDAVEPAIKALQLISDFVKKTLKKRGGEKDLQNIHLFIQASVFNGNKRRFINSVDNETFQEKIYITEKDYHELKLIDPLRDWANEGYGVGDSWVFASHQYRRSLAIYSAASGLVQLGSLRKQLKHLLSDMSMYYREGATRAREIFSIDSKDHMAAEYERSKSEAEFYLYIFDVLFSPEPLHGVRGKAANDEKPRNDEEIAIIYEDKKQTIREYERGERAYKGTPLGGCGSTEPCEKKLSGVFSSCLGCLEVTIKPSRLDNVIMLQESFVKQLDVKSVEYRSELAELEQLQKFRAVNR